MFPKDVKSLYDAGRNIFFIATRNRSEEQPHLLERDKRCFEEKRQQLSFVKSRCLRKLYVYGVRMTC